MRRTDMLWLIAVLFAVGVSVYELRYHLLGRMPESAFYFRK